MIDPELTEKYLPYMAIVISKIIKNTFLQLFAIGFLICFSIFYNTYLSNYAQNKRFIKFVINELQKDKSTPFYDLINVSKHTYSGEKDLIKIAQFFTRLTEVNLSIAKKYGNKVKIWQVVVNDMPSYVYQLNNNFENNKIIRDKTDSMVSEKQKEFGYSLLLTRKYNFDINPIMKHISIYWENGENQSTFEQNIKNSKGVNITLNTTLSKPINDSVGKINGIMLDKKSKSSLIDCELKGQFTIMKIKSGAILLFLESGGEQKRLEITSKEKTLKFFYFKNKYDMKQLEKLYELLKQTGILDTL